LQILLQGANKLDLVGLMFHIKPAHGLSQGSFSVQHTKNGKAELPDGWKGWRR
jgi:hypothetical protein